ncbi:MAG TPA: hypothetical protein VGH34_22135 [Vicinamibacterales bacterium]
MRTEIGHRREEVGAPVRNDQEKPKDLDRTLTAHESRTAVLAGGRNGTRTGFEAVLDERIRLARKLYDRVAAGITSESRLIRTSRQDAAEGLFMFRLAD